MDLLINRENIVQVDEYYSYSGSHFAYPFTTGIDIGTFEFIFLDFFNTVIG